MQLSTALRIATTAILTLKNTAVFLQVLNININNKIFGTNMNRLVGIILFIENVLK